MLPPPPQQPPSQPDEQQQKKKKKKKKKSKTKQQNAISLPPPQRMLPPRLRRLHEMGFTELDQGGAGNCWWRVLSAGLRLARGRTKSDDCIHPDFLRLVIAAAMIATSSFFGHSANDEPADWRKWIRYCDGTSRSGTYLDGDEPGRLAATAFGVTLRVIGPDPTMDTTMAPINELLPLLIQFFNDHPALKGALSAHLHPAILHSDATRSLPVTPTTITFTNCTRPAVSAADGQHAGTPVGEHFRLGLPMLPEAGADIMASLTTEANAFKAAVIDRPIDSPTLLPWRETLLPSFVATILAEPSRRKKRLRKSDSEVASDVPAATSHNHDEGELSQGDTAARARATAAMEAWSDDDSSSGSGTDASSIGSNGSDTEASSAGSDDDSAIATATARREHLARRESRAAQKKLQRALQKQRLNCAAMGDGTSGGGIAGRSGGTGDDGGGGDATGGANGGDGDCRGSRDDNGDGGGDGGAASGTASSAVNTATAASTSGTVRSCGDGSSDDSAHVRCNDGGDDVAHHHGAASCGNGGSGSGSSCGSGGGCEDASRNGTAYASVGDSAHGTAHGCMSADSSSVNSVDDDANDSASGSTGSGSTGVGGRGSGSGSGNGSGRGSSSVDDGANGGASGSAGSGSSGVHGRVGDSGSGSGSGSSSSSEGDGANGTARAYSGEGGNSSTCGGGSATRTVATEPPLEASFAAVVALPPPVAAPIDPAPSPGGNEVPYAQITTPPRHRSSRRIPSPSPAPTAVRSSQRLSARRTGGI